MMEYQPVSFNGKSVGGPKEMILNQAILDRKR